MSNSNHLVETPTAGYLAPGRHHPRTGPATVLVLWTGYPPGPPTCRSLKRAGFRVVGAFPEGRMGGRSMACPRPMRYPSPVADPDGFISAVARICRDAGAHAVVPLDEDAVRLLAERRDDLGNVVVVGPTAEQYATLCDKLELTRTAEALGLDTPDTVVVDRDGPDGPWPALPSIVKPRTSRSEMYRPRLAATPGERDAYVAELVAADVGAIVQERIEGRRLVVRSVRSPQFFEFVACHVIDDWPRGAGPASFEHPIDPPPRLVAAARALLDHVGYVGPSGVSFLEREGRYYPHDANLRLGASSPASICAGFDFPRRSVEAALEMDGTPFSGDWRPGRYMRLDLELEALGAAWRNRHDDGKPLRVLGRIARVGLSRDDTLFPSPIDPFWVGQIAARGGRKVGRSARSAVRAHRKGA